MARRIGATGAIINTEFLASTDNWFRPVNFANTPEGTLLILDMYRETIEHPFSIPEPIKKHLDLTSGRDHGRLYALVHAGAKARRRSRPGDAPAADLVKLLADPDAWWRETAQRLLFERQDRSAVPASTHWSNNGPTPWADSTRFGPSNCCRLWTRNRSNSAWPIRNRGCAKQRSAWRKAGSSVSRFCSVKHSLWPMTRILWCVFSLPSRLVRSRTTLV